MIYYDYDNITEPKDRCSNCKYAKKCELAGFVNFCEECKYYDECDICYDYCNAGHPIECNNGFELKLEDWEDEEIEDGNK